MILEFAISRAATLKGNPYFYTAVWWEMTGSDAQSPGQGRMCRLEDCLRMAPCLMTGPRPLRRPLSGCLSFIMKMVATAMACQVQAPAGTLHLPLPSRTPQWVSNKRRPLQLLANWWWWWILPLTAHPSTTPHLTPVSGGELNTEVIANQDRDMSVTMFTAPQVWPPALTLQCQCQWSHPGTEASDKKTTTATPIHNEKESFALAPVSLDQSEV